MCVFVFGIAELHAHTHTRTHAHTHTHARARLNAHAGPLRTHPELPGRISTKFPEMLIKVVGIKDVCFTK